MRSAVHIVRSFLKKLEVFSQHYGRPTHFSSPIFFSSFSFTLYKGGEEKTHTPKENKMRKISMSNGLRMDVLF